MADKLVIVESPTKARTIARYLGKEYEVLASGGHVRDLPKDDFGVDVENNFAPTYKVLPRSRQTIGKLKKSSDAAQIVYLAPDPDREGEAIAWHLVQALKLTDEKVRRATFHEITREAVQEAFNSPRALDTNLVDAQQARRILDRIVGYELSPLISKKILRGLSAGRVQSVALRLVCEREDEVDAFEPVEYWEIVARLTQAKKKTEFEAKLGKLGGEDLSLSSQSEADSALEQLKSAQYAVAGVEARETKSRPGPPFITSTLQQAASSQLGMSTDATMREAQRLYEGIEMGGESEGLITYMRTDSTRVADRALESVRELIGEQFGKEYLPAKAQTFKSPKASQGAHEAIRPTDVGRTPESVKEYLSKRQYQLYELIWRRFVASQMKPAVYRVTKVRIEAGEGTFVAQGRETVFEGHTKVLPPAKDDKTQALPALAEGEALELHGLESSQHFTQPPARYTEASLVREMERRGIGRPSTYAPTISTLLKRNYVRRQRRTLFPTELGRTVTRKLVKHFPREVNYTFTRDLEEQLDKIEGGEADLRETLQRFYDKFHVDLQKANEEMTAIGNDESNEEERTCEKCGKKMIVRFSRKGDKFLGCSGFPKCDFTISLSEEEAEVSEHKCAKCGAPMLIKRGRRGRPYLACSAFPKCSNIMGLDKEGQPVEMKPRSRTSLKCAKCGGDVYVEEGDEGGALRCGRCSEVQPLLSLEEALKKTEESGEGTEEVCEECGGRMIMRKGKKGLFLGCSNFPQCKTTRTLKADEFPAPVATSEACPECGRPMAVRWGRYGRFLACIGFPKCRSTRPLAEKGGEGKKKGKQEPQ